MLQMDEKLVEIVERWRDNAADFVKECLGAIPTPQQSQALAAVSQPGARVSITSGHGTGKSTLFAWIIYWAVCCFYDVKVAVTAPTSHQLMDILWAEVAKWRNSMLEPWKSEICIKADKVTLNGSIGFAVARTSRRENPEALQGFHAKHMIFLMSVIILRNVTMILSSTRLPVSLRRCSKPLKVLFRQSVPVCSWRLTRHDLADIFIILIIRTGIYGQGLSFRV